MNLPTNAKGNANGFFQSHDKPLLKTLFWNADGLTHDKFTELKHIIMKNDIDVYAIAEAGASTDSIEFFQMVGYQTFVLKRSRQVASGLIVAAKITLAVKFSARKLMGQSDPDKLELAELEVWHSGRHRRLFFAYNPPRNVPNLSWLEAEWNSKCILMGDLNAPSVLWGYDRTDVVGRTIEDFINSNPILFIENDLKGPTFLSHSGFTSHPDVVLAHPSLESCLFHTLDASPSGIGHRLLLVTLNQGSYKNYVHEISKPKWNFKKAKWELYAELADTYLTPDLVDDKVDHSLRRITEAILKSAKQSIPRGKPKKYAPFWNEELTKLKKQRDSARDKAEKTQALDDRQKLKQKSAELRKKIIQSKRGSFRNFLEELDFRRDGIKAHKFVSRLSNEYKEPAIKPMQRGSKLLTTGRDIARYFCDHYAKVSNFKPSKDNSKCKTRNYLTCPNEEEDRLCNDEFDKHELDSALKKNKTGKSAGPDEMMPEFLSNLGDKARGTLLKYINLVWKSHIPAEWRKAEIIPIPKSGKQLNAPEDFRPIALTSVVSKLFERMVLQRLQIHLENSKGLSPNQAGFSRHRNTTEQTLRFCQDVKNGFHRQQSTLAVFVDFSTAFDRVWRDGLIYKLKLKGVNGCMLKSITSFLSQRFIRVKYKSATSKYKQTRQGLPQGSVISPILFNLMVDDIVDSVQAIPGTQALLYADDLVIWATSSNIVGLERGLTLALNELSKWSKKNEMQVNVQKTVFQLFTLSTKQHSISLKLDGQPVSRTSEATYLGIKLDSKLNWGKQIEVSINKGTKRTRLLNRLTGTKWGASQDVLVQTYKTYIRPAMEYGAEVIASASESALKKLDVTQNRALRIITGAPRSTPIASMHLQTGIEPLQVRRDIAVLRTYERIRRLGIDYWENGLQATQRLKTQKTFAAIAEEVASKYEIPTAERQAFPKLKTMRQKHLARGSLSLVRKAKKDEVSEIELKAMALETIHERYPEREWFHVYTDGSAQNGKTNAGAGVFTSEFTIAEPVGAIASNFDGEIKAILLALNRIKETSHDKVVLFVDAQAAIMELSSPTPSELNDVLECRMLISSLIGRRTEVVLQWIPSHCGIKGNEEADRLAKLGASMSQPAGIASYGTAKRWIGNKTKKAIKEMLAIQAEGKRWASLTNGVLPRGLPRSQAVACFRMLTGHDYLRAHLYRIGVADSPMCSFCGDEIMTADHLFECGALSHLNTNDDCSTRAEIYWATRRRMAERQ